MLDTLICDAEVYDGDGGDPKKCSVGIQKGKIAYVGDRLGANAAKETLSGEGCWLSPGFIDSHASTGLGYLMDHAADHKLYQGVTLELIGNCGTSTAPVGPELVATMERLSDQIGFPFSWQHLGAYFEHVEQFGLPINLATLVGHSTLRGGRLKDWKSCSDIELQSMKSDLNRAMTEGSFGLSSGLIYPPGCYAETSELIELGKIVANHGGFYASHIRDERDKLEDAVNEALEIGRGAGIPVLVSHLKAADKPNWGKIPHILDSIENFRRRHDMKVIVDVYPYTAVSTKLRAFLPKELLVDGIDAVSEKLANPQWRQRASQWLRERNTDLENMIVISEDIAGTTGLSVADIAAKWGQSAEETACELVRRIPETWIVYHCISQADMDKAILWPDAIVCSDSWSYPVNAKTKIGNPHPRTFGAFSRFLDQYVFERPLLSYGDAVRKVTSQPADFMGITDRGRIRVGYHADMLLMDPKQFADNATYQEPKRFSDGVRQLWINGKLTLSQGEIVNDKAGRAIRPHAA